MYYSTLQVSFDFALIVVLMFPELLFERAQHFSTIFSWEIIKDHKILRGYHRYNERNSICTQAHKYCIYYANELIKTSVLFVDQKGNVCIELNKKKLHKEHRKLFKWKENVYCKVSNHFCENKMSTPCIFMQKTFIVYFELCLFNMLRYKWS